MKNDKNNKTKLSAALIIMLLSTPITTAMAGSVGKGDYVGGDLIKLGIGGCRDLNGTHGKYKLHGYVSLQQCKNLCFGKSPCAAVEYNRKKNECEVHYNKITSLSDTKSGYTTCYIYH